MPLAVGTRLGPYEILSAIGAGGMGEVYRARDPHLNRDVALKILPELFALEPDRVSRFKREAQVLASLNHPHIAAIYGFEETNGVQALALSWSKDQPWRSASRRAHSRRRGAADRAAERGKGILRSPRMEAHRSCSCA
jgi:serine/threonine protein kinase